MLHRSLRRCSPPSFSPSLLGSLLAAALALATSRDGTGQCTPQWQLASGFGADGPVDAVIEWDPDGAGPAGLHLVVGGLFQHAGGVSASNVALFDPVAATWSALGAGTNGGVQALAVEPGGGLLIGGVFTTAGGVGASGIARWDGSAWHDVGGGIAFATGGVRALAVLPGGEVVAGGLFTLAGAVAVQNIALWDGVSWSSMAGGLPATLAFPSDPHGVRSLAVTTTGALVAGGTFGQSPVLPTQFVAVWSNGAWSAAPGVATSIGAVVRSVAALPGGNFLAAGSDGTVAFVKEWNGSSWQSLGVPPANVQAVGVLLNGERIAIGGAVIFATSTIARWNGTAWISIGTIPFGSLGEWGTTLTPYAAGGPASFVMGGRFSSVSGTAARSLAIWTGSSWIGDAGSLSGGALRVATDATGQLVVCGPQFGAAIWNGATWQTLGPGLPASGGAVDIAIRPDGEIVVCGTGGVLRRTAAGWVPMLGGAMPLNAVRLLAGPGDALVAYGQNVPSAARWNGATWQGLGPNLNASALAFLPNGDLVGGGNGTSFNGMGRVARWNGTTWTPLDPTDVLDSTVRAVAALPNGDVIAGGQFTFGNSIARYDGVSWQPMGAGFNAWVLTLEVTPEGELFAGGGFTASGGVPCAGLARWDGSSWQPVQGGSAVLGSYPQDIAFHPSGDLIVTGQFTSPTPFLARLATPCPAASTVAGSACASSGGANRLVAPSWPLLGGMFRSRATGLPATSLALAVSGWTTLSVPLAGLLAGGQPGCFLLVSPDVLELVLAAGGTATWQFALPVDPTLVGVVFHHQMVPVELDAFGNLGAVTSTNALTLTVGSVQ